MDQDTLYTAVKNVEGDIARVAKECCNGELVSLEKASVPGESGLAGWAIALIVAACFIVPIIIITVSMVIVMKLM